ncbi:MAG: efflux RND transporter periplasmic adaptor subunit [Steroidobacterales bacterium]
MARVALFRICVSIAASAALAACSGHAASGDRAPPAVPVSVAVAALQSVANDIRAVGTIESTGSVAILPRIDGPIEKVWVRDGEEVKAGQRLVAIDPAPFQIALRAATAMLARDAALLENARAKRDEGRRLFEQKFISADALTQLQTDHDAASATVESDRAALDNARLQLSYTTILAPVAGKLGHIALQKGNFLRAAAAVPITTLEVLDPVDVSFTIPAQQIDLVRAALAGSRPKVTVRPATDGDGAPAESGVLSFIDNTADPTTGTIRLRARLANPDHRLWPGAFLSVTLDLPSAAAVVTIPAAAVAQGPNGPYVFVVDAGSTAEMRAVTVVRTTSNLAIVQGVHAGERIVTDGQSRVTPHGRVAIEAPRRAP